MQFLTTQDEPLWSRTVVADGVTISRKSIQSFGGDSVIGAYIMHGLVSVIKSIKGNFLVF